MSERIAKLLVRFRWALLGLAAALSLAAIVPAQRLSLDRSIENMFAADDPLVASYQQLRRVFGGNEIVLAVYTDEQLFAADKSGIRRAEAIRRRLERVPGVRAVLSIDQPLGDFIVDEKNPLAQALRELFAGYTHSVDGRTVAAACMLVPREQAVVPRDETIDELRRVMEHELPSPLAAGIVAGEPVMVHEGFRVLEQDGARLGWASTIMLALVILYCFRSVRWVVIPLLVVQATLLWTKALLAFTGLKLTLVSSMLTAVVTVVGIATVIHVIVRYRESRVANLPPRAALLQAIAFIALPVFWACATDAVGFASLLVARVGPVQDFGVMMVIGSLLVMVAAALILPALALVGSAHERVRPAWGEGRLNLELTRLVDQVEKHRWLVGMGSLLVAAASIAGVSHLQVETDFTKNFRQGSSIVTSYEFIEDRLGGAGVWDIMLPAPAAIDVEFLQRVAKLEARLRSEVLVENEQGERIAGLTKVLSLVDAIVAASPTVLDRAPENFFERNVANGVIRVATAGMQTKMPVFSAALYAADPDSPEQHWLRIMLRSRERQSSANKEQIIRAVRRIVEEEFPAQPDQPRAQVTGFFVLLTSLIDSVLADQWTAFFLATLGIGLMMLVALRSVRYAFVALVPNAAPILIITGLMGWLGVKVNMGAAMIAAVSMGLSIDSSIHYIIAFQRARSAGRSVKQALVEVQKSVGRAMVFSTLALIAGFGVLCLSEFIPTIYFGAIVSLTMLGGLAGNLVVLPLLLVLVTPQRKEPRL